MDHRLCSSSTRKISNHPGSSEDIEAPKLHLHALSHHVFYPFPQPFPPCLSTNPQLVRRVFPFLLSGRPISFFGLFFPIFFPHCLLLEFLVPKIIYHTKRTSLVESGFWRERVSSQERGR